MGEHDFETVSSETAFLGRILALRVDEVRMPGGTVAKRVVVEHYGAVAVVAVDDDNRVALIYQYRHALGRRLWELPAGLLDVEGEDPTVAAARELEEEAGLIAQEWSVLADVDSSPGVSDESLRIFLARGVRNVGRPVPDDDEESDIRMQWFDLDDAVAQVLSGEIVNSTAVVGILAAHNVILGGKKARPVDAPWPDRSTSFAARQSQS